MQDPEVIICLPPRLPMIQGMVERLRNIADTITIFGNMNHQLTFSVNADTAMVQARFTDCQHPSVGGHAAIIDENKTATVNVDAKQFQLFFQAVILKPQSVICCLVSHRSACIHMPLSEGAFITYYFSAKVM